MWVEILLGLLVLLIYSFGIVMVSSVFASRSVMRDIALIEKYKSREGDDADWEEDEELDENGEVIARSFKLITNKDLENKRSQKQKDNEDDDEV